MSEEVAQANEAPAEVADNAVPAANEQAEDAVPAEPVEELVEIEREGKKYAVPKELRDEFLMRQDYTRKTQEVAEQRKLIEQEREQTHAQIARERELVKANREFAATLHQLDEFQAITPEVWQQWTQQDASAAQSAFMRFQALKDKAGALNAKIQQDEARKAFEAQRSTAKQLEQAISELRTAIPDWSERKSTELKEHAKKLGATDKSADGVREAWIVKALHESALYRQSLKSATAPSPSPEVKPIRTISGQAKAAVDPDKMSIDDWMKWDAEQQRKKRRA